jgi:phosphoribosyl-ATP pyrophosphohydrolase
VQNEEEVKRNWEQIKLSEGKKSVLAGVPASLPALVKALRLQEKAKQVGFEWEQAEQVLGKVREEEAELMEAISQGTPAQREAEFGDLLFDYSVIMENQLLFALTYTDTERTVTNGTVSYSPVCTWITDQDVLDWLGVAPATANDLDFVSACTDAANALAYRRRKESGYTDSLSVVPGADIALGVRMYAGSLYRQRGSVDSFQSFEAYAAGSPAVASMGEILRLWACNRPQVG